MKTVNPLAALDVLFAPTPREAKRRGNSVVLRPGWDEHLRVPVMQRVLAAKFAREPYRSLLLSTGDGRRQCWREYVRQVVDGSAL